MTVTEAAVVESGGAPFTLSQVELAEPQAGEVLVRMVAAGLCHTDLGVASGGLPFPWPGVLGHEGAGVVEEVGAGVTRVKPGDQVLLSFTSCGACRNCRDGHPAYCATWLPDNLIGGRRADGSATITRDGEPLGGHFFGQSSFARMAVVDERSLLKVSPDAPLELLAPLGCGVITGFGTVWNVLRPQPGSTLAVFGTGAVGLSALMAAAQLPLGAVVPIDSAPGRPPPAPPPPPTTARMPAPAEAQDRSGPASETTRAMSGGRRLSASGQNGSTSVPSSRSMGETERWATSLSEHAGASSAGKAGSP